MAKCFEKTLIDSHAGIYEEEWEIDSSSMGGLEGPPWSVTKFTLRGGKQHGVDVVELDNGLMAITIVPTRGMNVLEAVADDVVLGWDSPVGEVVHPAYIKEESRGGLGWLEGFNELVSRCGLESHGLPGPDVAVDNEGNQTTIMLPLHGRISNTPASRVWFSLGLGPRGELTVGGEVYEARMFGPSYMLHTTISTVPGADWFTITDEVYNISARPQELELLYHCNYGPPILGEGARLVAPVQKVTARDQRALEDVGSWERYGPPQAGFVEQCYFATLHADKKGDTVVALVGAEGDLAASLRFSTRRLPAFTVWKFTAAEADGYVTGLEPGTDYPNNRQFERQKGRVVRLKPDQCYKAAVTLGLVRGKNNVKALRGEIAALTRGKKTELCTDIDPELSPC